MKYSIEVISASSPEWIEAVLADFPSFLQDHADCERKASAMAMSLIAKYPDRELIIPDMIDTALEEMEHFQQVYQIMQQQGVKLPAKMEPDLYVKELMNEAKGGSEESRFLIRLLLGSVIECRGCERFKLVADHIEDPELKRFYKELWVSEAKHGNIYAKLALHYFDEDLVYTKLDELMHKEAKVLKGLKIRSALH
ncbi:MAG: tRNA-(ms[2]io[6]A)-hydroxylase [Roseivirga sp.]|nr:tRNA-(ms[2]io[6]A)-hydroxylase [Roseivirga sp.]